MKINVVVTTNYKQKPLMVSFHDKSCMLESSEPQTVQEYFIALTAGAQKHMAGCRRQTRCASSLFHNHGRRKEGCRGGLAPWILKISAKKGCFLNFEWEKKNFTTFVLPLKKFWKNPLVAPPWEKSFRRPRS